MRLLPQSLIGRVYLLYSSALLLFVGISFAAFYHFQYGEVIDEAQDSANVMIEVLSQTVTESAIIGDYDSIQRLLNKSILRSRFRSATFIDLTGTVVKAENNTRLAYRSPQWLEDAIGTQLYDVNLPISAGGADYGVLRLSFAVTQIAHGFWNLILISLGVAGLSVVGGLVLIWFPLRKWLGPLEQVESTSASPTPLQDIPLEIRPTFELLNRTTENLKRELANRERTLQALRETVSSFQADNAPSGPNNPDEVDNLTSTISRLVKERELAIADMRKAMDSAKQANQAKSQFLANMSHEIRTPLNGILGMADLVMGGPLTKEQQEYLQILNQSGYALLAIVNDILDFSKIEAGMLNVERIPFDIRNTLKTAAAPFYPQARVKGLDFETRFSDDVPHMMLGDPLRLLQILTNLIGNSFKFTKQGRVLVNVQMDTTKQHLQIEVSDTGIGIPALKQQSIFDVFTQADSSTTRTHGGTGLGLSICKRLVEMMNGQMTVSSIEGQGSTFAFYLPCTPVDVDPQVMPEEKQTVMNEASLSNSTASSGLQVLVAEDNMVNQILVRKLLERHQHTVTVAKDGLEAVELWKVGRYDAILMDMQMPKLSGTEATQKIRELELSLQRPKTPIIALTANALDHDRALCMAAGMDDYLSKPIQSELLYGCLARWTRSVEQPGQTH